MLAEAMRTRPLPEAVDLGPGPGGQGLKLQLREGNGGRSITVQLTADLATALQRLVEQALAAADWGLEVGPLDAGAAGPAGHERPVVLN